MSRGWKIALWILGGLWAFFLVAITMTPHDLWQHLVAWWGVVVAGVSLDRQIPRNRDKRSSDL